MSYEPTQQQIEAKELELVLEMIADTDSFGETRLGEAIGNDDGTLVEILLNFALSTSIDDKLNAHDKFLEALKDYFQMQSVARDMLISEVGYTVQTDVDDYEFVVNDTRC